MPVISARFKRPALLAAGLGLLICLSPQAASAQFYYQRPIGPLPPHAIGEIATMELGLHPVSRVLRSGSVYFVEGTTARGAQVRYTVDAYYGQVLDRSVVHGPARGGRHERARFAGLGPSAYAAPPGYFAPDDDEYIRRPPGRVRDGARSPAPQPKTASAINRPPTAPAKVLPATPAALPEKAVPRPVVRPPVPTVTPTPVPRPLPSEVKATPEPPKPRLQNPDDLRIPSEPDRAPPLAASSTADPARPGAGNPVSARPAAGAAGLAPALLDDATPKSTKPPTAPVPVTPLD